MAPSAYRVGLVVVSHSRALGDAAVELAQQMLDGQDVVMAVAAGVEGGGFGTNAVEIVDAVEQADRGDGVVVLMDLGSAVLSAELALELLDDEQRARVLLCPAPLVEGLVVACVAAAGGASREAVATEALGGLDGKQAHFLTASPQEPADRDERAAESDDEQACFVVDTPNGLHARPASRLVQLAMAAGVPIELRNVTTGSDWVPANSMMRVTTLGVLSGHRVEARASGAGAREALDSLVDLASRRFGEDPA